ncbi:MAG: hypothetical protein ABL308_04315 [Oceanicaulis sp.]
MTAAIRTAPQPLQRAPELRPMPAPGRLSAVMLGCGVVGGGVADRLPAGIALLGVLARTPREARVGGAPVTTDPDALFALDPDLVIEALPAGADAERLLERAVVEGRHVITANKDVAARRPDLARRAADAGRVFACSAAVGGGAPILETAAALRESGAGLVRVRGVLNGTSNFVLDRLAAGESLKSAVAAAQAAGFAEADPSADLDGVDAANKLALIARAAWGAELDPASIKTESISALPKQTARAVRESGRVLRQVATLGRRGAAITARVRLEAVEPGDPAGRARGEGNIAVFQPERGAEVIVAGKGAGREPTAASVIADIERLLERCR